MSEPTLSFLRPDDLAVSKGYSHGVISTGPLLHVAGQVALDATGQTVGVGDLGKQAEQALSNLERVLVAAGVVFGSVAALTVYVVSAVPRTDLGALGEALRRRIAQGPPPAITLLFVHALMDPEWLIEVQAVAVAGKPLSRAERAMLELGA